MFHQCSVRADNVLLRLLPVPRTPLKPERNNQYPDTDCWLVVTLNQGYTFKKGCSICWYAFFLPNTWTHQSNSSVATFFSNRDSPRNETKETTAMTTRRLSIPEIRGKARLGYVYASPLCEISEGRKRKMELLDTAQVGVRCPRFSIINISLFYITHEVRIGRRLKQTLILQMCVLASRRYI